MAQHQVESGVAKLGYAYVTTYWDLGGGATQLPPRNHRKSMQWLVSLSQRTKETLRIIGIEKQKRWIDTDHSNPLK